MALKGQCARQRADEDPGQEFAASPPTPAHRQKQTRLSPDQVDELVATYLAGTPLRELAEQFDINDSTVLAHLRRRKVPKRPFRKLRGQQLARAIELYGAGMSLRSVAAELDVSKDSVRSVLVAAGVGLRSPR